MPFLIAGCARDRWSRRWHEDPPVGTIVGLGGGLVEIHVGREPGRRSRHETRGRGRRAAPHIRGGPCIGIP